MSLAVSSVPEDRIQAARLIAVTASILAHVALAIWLFGASDHRQASGSEPPPLDVTTIPLSSEPPIEAQDAPTEVPSIQQESEIQASEPPAIETTPAPDIETTNPGSPDEMPDSGSAETVSPAPPSAEIQSASPPAETQAQTDQPLPSAVTEPPQAVLQDKPPVTIEAKPPAVSAAPTEIPGSDIAASDLPQDFVLPDEAILPMARPDDSGSHAAPDVPKHAIAQHDRPQEQRPRETANPSRAASQKDGQESKNAPSRVTSRGTKGSSPADRRVRANYMAGVASRLLSRKYFPPGAPSGTVVVHFSLGSSGKLLGRSVARSSGSPILDAAALRIVERAAPFPPFPEGVGTMRLSFNVPMSFSAR